MREDDKIFFQWYHFGLGMLAGAGIVFALLAAGILP